MSAADGFPWDKVDAAKRYLSTIKPWWGRFLEKFVIVPVEVMPDVNGVLPYGSTTATDREFRIYIDRNFAIEVPLHYLAGALEHEAQRHTRDTWNRLRFLVDDAWRKEGVPALDLEINSSIDREQQNMTMEDVYFVCENSALFTIRDLERWNVQAPPGFDGLGWVPRAFGFADGLSAEEYHAAVKAMFEQLEREKDEQEEQEEDKEPPEDEEAPDSEQSSESSDADDGEEGGETGEDSESSGEEDEHTEDGGDAGDGDEGEGDGSEDSEAPSETDGESQSDNKGEEGGLNNPGSGESGDQEDDGADSEQGSETDSGESGDSGEQEGQGEQDSQDPGEESESEGSDDLSDGDSDGSNSEGGDEAGGERGGGAGGSPMSVQEQAQAYLDMEQSELGKMWRNSIENPNDVLDHPAWKPDSDTPEYELPESRSPSDIREAFAALKEDIEEYKEELEAVTTGYGNLEGSHLFDWRDEYIKANGLNWDRVFTKLANSMMSSIQIKGQSDLSYSVRNPNQPPLGIILPGLLSYSPTIYVLQDVSGSMMTDKKMARSMSSFTDLCKKVVATYGDKVTWFSADTSFVDVGSTTRWDERSKSYWSVGFGGTEGFGVLIEELMTGKAKFRGKKYKRPELLVVSTDCCFPWPEKRPRTSTKLLVVNVGSADDAELFLPDWLDRKREFVQVDDF